VAASVSVGEGALEAWSCQPISS